MQLYHDKHLKSPQSLVFPENINILLCYGLGQENSQ